mgnify:CR=1 FL=1
MRKTVLLPFILMMICFQGCIPPNQIEDTAIINARGVDLIEVEGERIIETTIVPFLFDPNAEEMTNILVGRGKTIKGAREDAAKQSSYLLSPGKINIEVYGKEAAEAGIMPFLNTLIRDARVSDQIQLAVTNHTARELLEIELETITINTTEYLQDLSAKEVEQDKLPNNTLIYYTRLVEQVGIDPVLPIIDVVEGWPRLVEVALFQYDKYVGSVSLDESFLINLLRKSVGETPLNASVPAAAYEVSDDYHGEMTDEDLMHVFLNMKSGKGKLELVDEDELTYKAKVTLKGEVLETSKPIDFESEQVSKQLEGDIEDFFETEYEELFAKLQELQSDAFGLGRLYAATRKGSETTHEEWREMFLDTTVDFEVDFKITNYGTIE